MDSLASARGQYAPGQSTPYDYQLPSPHAMLPLPEAHWPPAMQVKINP